MTVVAVDVFGFDLVNALAHVLELKTLICENAQHGLWNIDQRQEFWIGDAVIGSNCDRGCGTWKLTNENSKTVKNFFIRSPFEVRSFYIRAFSCRCILAKIKWGF